MSWSQPPGLRPCIWVREDANSSPRIPSSPATCADAPFRDALLFMSISDSNPSPALTSRPSPLFLPSSHTQSVIYYVNIKTGERLPRRALSHSYQRRPKQRADLRDVVNQEQTALGKKIIEPTSADLVQRQMQMASTRSVFDRQIFAREFQLVELEISGEGGNISSQLVRRRGGDVIARLGPEETIIFKANQHLQQVFANGRPFRRAALPFSLLDRCAARCADDGSLIPRTSYARRQGEVKTVEHWGQRKLLLSEIEFLTMYGHLAHTVVYAGSAPGTHLNYLSQELFPEHRWILIDPAPFDAKETPQIEIRQCFFTDDIAKEFQGKNIIFICDIRSMEEWQSSEEKEERVHADMVWQQKWVEIMQPKVGCAVMQL